MLVLTCGACRRALCFDPSITTSFTGHGFLNSLEVSVCVIGFGEIFVFKALHFDFPHLEYVTLSIDVVTWLRVTEERLLVPTVYATETTTE